MKHLMKWVGFFLAIALVITPLHIVWADGDDTTGPALISSTPADGATDIGISQDIQLQFSENIHFTDTIGDAGTFTGAGSEPITIKRGSTYLGSTYAISSDTITLEGTWGAEDGSEVVVHVAAGAILDEAAAPNPSNRTFTFKFNLADTTSPTLSSTEPADNATDVAGDKVLVITYNEAIQQGTNWSNITVANGSTPISITQSISENELHISPDNAEGKWDGGTGGAYTLTIPAGAVEDAKGNAAGASTLNFSTTDTTGPTLTSSDPANNATGVAANKTIQLNFSENIHLAGPLPDTGTFTGTDSDPVIIMRGSTYLGSNYTISNNAIQMAGTWGDADGSTITVTVKAGQIVDTSSNPSTQDITVTFTLNDAGPTIVSKDPANNATNVPSNKVLIFTYNESLQQGTNWSSISATTSSTSIPITTEISGNELRITPNNPDSKWDNGIGISYTLSVPAGAVQDLNGNDAGASSLTFKSIDTTRPTLVSSNPADGTMNLNSNQSIQLVFSENISYAGIKVMKGSTNISFNSSITGNTLNITGTWGSDGSVITVILNAGAFRDYAYNYNVQSYTLIYTLKDLINPYVSSQDPNNNALNVLADKVLTLTYNEPIQEGINWTGITVTAGTTTIPIIKEISGKILTIRADNADHKWDDGITGISYVLTIPSDAIKDMRNNSGGQITLNFRTMDVTAPTLISSTPTNGAVNIPSNPTIQLIFSENIRLARDPASPWGIFYGNGDTEPITVKKGDDYYSSYYSISSNTIRLNGPWGVADGSVITITIKAGTVIDAVSNPNTSEYTISFNLEDKTAPTVSSTDPSNMSIAPADKVLTIVFSEPIQQGSAWNDISVESYSDGPNDSTNIPINKSMDGCTLTITANTADGNWDNGTGKNYNLHIPAYAIEDLSNNALASPTNLYFYTPHTIPPHVLSISPTYGATNLDASIVVSATFDEAVNKGLSYNGITGTCNGTNINISTSISNNIVRFYMSNGWAYTSTYVVNIPAGAFQDSRGNATADAITLQFSTGYKPVGLSLYKTPPETIVAGNSVTLYYSIDKKSNMRLDVLDSSDNVVKTLTQKNVKTGRHSIKWTSTKRKYDEYTLRLTATPVDTSTTSAAYVDTFVEAKARADVAIKSYTKTWDINARDFEASFTFNTYCDVLFTWKKGKKTYYMEEYFDPTSEGTVTLGTISVSGLSSMPSGSYTFTITIYNGASKDSASKTIKIINRP